MKKLDRLKVVMTEKKFNQYLVVREVRSKSNNCLKLMTNFSQPSFETLIKISKALNVYINELIHLNEVQIVKDA